MALCTSPPVPLPTARSHFSSQGQMLFREFATPIPASGPLDTAADVVKMMGKMALGMVRGTVGQSDGGEGAQYGEEGRPVTINYLDGRGGQSFQTRPSRLAFGSASGRWPVGMASRYFQLAEAFVRTVYLPLPIISTLLPLLLHTRMPPRTTQV